MEDDLNFVDNGRLPQLFGKWKTTSIFLKMEDDLICFGNGRRPKFFVNRRRPIFFKMGTKLLKNN